jgi:hypothetical protein
MQPDMTKMTPQQQQAYLIQQRQNEQAFEDLFMMNMMMKQSRPTYVAPQIYNTNCRWVGGFYQCTTW